MASDLRLATRAALKSDLQINASDTGNDTLLNSILDRASRIIESEVSRLLIYRETAYIEVHAINDHRSVIWLLDYPVLPSPAVVLTESASADHASATALTEGSDFFVDYAEGKITRVASGQRIQWLTGERVVKVTYPAGYDDADNDKANVPSDLQDVCLSLAAIRYREIAEKLQAVSQRSDASGAQIRQLSRGLTHTHLTKEHREMLQPYYYVGTPTGVRVSA